MAYNNGFPVTYPAYYPQYQQMQAAPQQQAQPQNNGIIWVQGEAGAKSYLVAPNNTVQLWDSEDQVIYLKSADASGMPSMKILDYKIREASNQNAAQNVVAPEMANYVTKDELLAFEAKIRRQLDKLTPKAKEEEDG